MTQTPDKEQSLDSQIISAREELARTLDAIEEKFNVPKRLLRASDRAKLSFRRNPAPWVAGAGVAALAIGGLVFAAVRRGD